MLHFNATLLFVLVSFLIFMGIMKAIFFDPMLRIKAQREHRLLADREAAQQFAQDYERLNADYEAALRSARREAQRVIQELRAEAKVTASQTLAKARVEAQAEMDAQIKELAQWREATYQQMGEEREELARTIVRKITEHRPVGTLSGG